MTSQTDKHDKYPRDESNSRKNLKRVFNLHTFLSEGISQVNIQYRTRHLSEILSLSQNSTSKFIDRRVLTTSILAIFLLLRIANRKSWLKRGC